MYQLLQTAFIRTDLTDRVHPVDFSRVADRNPYWDKTAVGTQRTHSLGEYRMVHRTPSAFSM